MDKARRMKLEMPHRSDLCDSHREEVASLVTHGLATVLSVVALAMMIVRSGGEPVKVVASAVFGVSMVLLYLSSTLYHFFTAPRWKAHFQSLDHAWHRLPFNHAIWHLFVMGGSLCHVLAVMFYVLR